MSKNVPVTESIDRFTLAWRVHHILFALAIFGLALSGLAYRWYDTGFGQFLIGIEGGFDNRGIMHRICAALLGLTTLWHIGRVVFTRDGHEDFLALMPEAGDGGRWLAALKAKLAGKPIDVEWGRYTLGQKAQYWAVGCGTILMLASGVILLFGHTAVAALPKWLVDTIRVTHGGQGVELMVFIILWHIYSTHFAPHRFPMDHSWLTGKISKEQLKVYHRREYRRIFGEDPK